MAATSCASATPGAPVCGTLLLPKLAASSQVFMSLGACDDDLRQVREPSRRLHRAGARGPDRARTTNPKRAEVDLYTKTSPATLILKCDTSLCGTAAIQAIPVNFSFAGNGPLDNGRSRTALRVLARGPWAQDQDVCVDYVQSKRDGASDTILYLLFTRDLRGGIG